MSAERFTLFPASITHAGGTMNLAQMQGFNVQTQTRKARIQPAGSVDPAAHVLAFADPVVRFGTRDLATLLATVSPSAGLKLSGSGAFFRLRERDDGGTFLTGATHETYDVAQGLVVLDTLTANQDDEQGAICQCMLHATYDGANEPIVHNTGVDFSLAPSPAFVSEYWLGPAYHNGAEIKGLVSSSVEFGVNVSPRRVSGQVFAQKLAIVRRQPVLRLTILKADATAALSLFTRGLSGTFSLYFQKGVNNGARVAANSASHVKISATAGEWSDEEITAEENDDGTVSIVVMPTGVLSTSVASTIP